MDTSKSPCNGVNCTPNHVRVTIQDVLVPGAVLRLHDVPLSSFGPPLFDVFVKKTKLQSRAIPPDSDSFSNSPLLSELPSEFRNSNQELLEFLSQPIPPESDWTTDLNNPMDFCEDINDLEADRLSLDEGLVLLRAIEENPSIWPAEIRSRVLMDVWHAMARIKVPKEHGCRRPFAQALRDAIFIPDQKDKLRISNYLTSIGSSWNDVLHLNAKWL